MRRRIPTAAALAILGLAVAAAAAPAATDYSYIKRGTYTATGRIEAFQSGATSFPQSTYPASFVVSSKTRRGPRTMKSLKLGPVAPVCSNTSVIPTRHMAHTFPRLSGFPPITIPFGFIVRSYVLRGAHWKPTKSGVVYSGLLPHIELQLVYNRTPARFNPNPLTQPSLKLTVRIDDQGKISSAGPWTCTVAGVLTFRKR